MAKTVSLNEFTYSKLAALSGELTMISKKPISLGLTIHMALVAFEGAIMHNPTKRKLFAEELKKLSSTETLEQDLDAMYKSITKNES